MHVDPLEILFPLIPWKTDWSPWHTSPTLYENPYHRYENPRRLNRHTKKYADGRQKTKRRKK